MAFSAFATGTAQEQAPRRKSKIALLLLLPGILYLMLFFLVPLVSLVITSFQAPVPYGDIGEFQTAFKWQNYVDVVNTYGEHILRSFGYAILATIFALLFSYPLAYFIGVKARRWPLLQNLMLVLVIAPFFISFLLRTLAWKSILSDESFVISGLKALSLMAPDAHFTGTAAAVVFGLTYNFIPFMTLPLYSNLQQLDTRLLEAGSDLYSTPSKTFFKVTVPLSMTGIVSGVLLTFIPAAGDYINASRDFLGGTGTAMIGNVIESNFLVTLNYPVAAALSIILMAVILVMVTVYVKRSGTEDLL
ncbi:spermidine/putrescine transport system permease protein [Cryobacterium mesophilum]|uniref:ABC transporter permease n=1 Tax=Terrimesophilobacter mesophilus TaxID=433647 RepID=A0A4R8VCD2_9MICO|nr:ABC transporter permease [Terrimesophilobacter mesophilus]MBB5634006.1 spermidine/putrescine transport system permease protein [Terrimesophilobacter mesophilus]TFB80659.1 ABC transporter permease [Terrimesophilobacter mesophilus]